MFSLALRNLRYHWRTNSAVALGVIAATAVLTGALVVGDSVRGSLRSLVFDRLGQIDDVLVAPRFFRADLAGEVTSHRHFVQSFSAALPAIMLEGTLERTTGDVHHRAGGVSVLGVGPAFWQLGHGGPSAPPQRDEIVLNRPLADQLRVKVGDEVVLRLPQATLVPGDSPLGRKTETARSRRFTVSAIIPAEGLGRFGIRPTQQLPLDAFTAIEPLAQLVDAPGRVNAILVAGRDENSMPSIVADRAINRWLEPQLSDYDLSLRKTDRGYFNLTTDRMMLEPAVVAAATKAFAGKDAQPALTYLANYIETADGRGKIPYSTIAAIDFSAAPPLGPLLNLQGQPIGPLANDEIVLNSWAADDLAEQGAGVKPGDTIEITYFEPESLHGAVTETSHKFRLKDITPLSGVADDPNFTPDVKGVTDEASIANWNPPFPYDAGRVRSVPPNNQDDLYWRKHKATPKAFVSLEQGRKLWGSRFGNTTSIRIAATSDVDTDSLAQKLLHELKPAAMGFEFMPVKRQGLVASAGTTPFELLFLGFSMFIITAALMLVTLLFKLGVDERATELGILLGIGFRRKLVRRILLVESAIVAAMAAAVGTAAGIGYAWLMLVGLKTWWLGAISTPFLQLFVVPTTLALGFGCGLAVSLITIVWAMRQLRRASVRRLLCGHAEESRQIVARHKRIAPWLAEALLIAALGTAVAAVYLRGDARALPFFGAGALVVVALLVWTWDALRAEHGLSLVSNRAPLLRLAWCNGGRRPLRSTLTIGLTAMASFLIVGLSAFEINPHESGPAFKSGDGGFNLIAQSDQPIYQDLNSADARRDLGFSDKADRTLATAQHDGAHIFSFRVKHGDDASCLNLYQPRQSRILGVSQQFIDRGGFDWGGNLAANDWERVDPWLLLDRGADNPTADDNDAPIPVILDENTAIYSLHLSGGAGDIFEIDRPGGGKIKLQVVALLKDSLFQGDLLMSEANFLRLFPDVSGYRYFLIEAPPEYVAPLADTLENELGDYGFIAQTAADRLAEFFAVQNTYLATFRSLGGLGLLLGTFGLAAVQLRGIVERRGELALLQATGFRRRRVARMVLMENASLLVAGLGIGTIAALVALIPHLLRGGAAIPWLSLAGTLGIILAVGLLAGLISVRAVLRAPILDALRGE